MCLFVVTVIIITKKAYLHSEEKNKYEQKL